MRIFTSPAGRFVVGNCVLLFGPDAEPRGSGDLPQELDIHVQIAGHGQRFSGVTSGQDGSGQVFDGEQCGVIVKAAAQGAVIGHIADGQPGQPSGDVDAGKLFQRELQRIGAIGLPGKSGGTVRVDAIVGQRGLFAFAVFPERHADLHRAHGTGAQGQQAEQQPRDQHRPGAFPSCFHFINLSSCRSAARAVTHAGNGAGMGQTALLYRKNSIIKQKSQSALAVFHKTVALST